MIGAIIRIDNKVYLEVHTGLIIKTPMIHFYYTCASEMSAELLKCHLRNHQDKARKVIARKPHCYLSPKEISKLKSDLKKWNEAKHCWKKSI